MRNLLLFLGFVLLSLVGGAVLRSTQISQACYGLETPPQLATRFEATTRSYLEPMEGLQEFLAAK